MVKVGEGAGVEGLEAAALGWSEVVGEREGEESVEGATDLSELALELDGAGGDGGGAGLRAQAAERVAQQQAAVGLVGAAEELDEIQGLVGGQALALGTVEELVLILVAELAQRVCERRADGPPGELALGGRRQAGADGQPSVAPAGLVPQQTRGGARGEPILVDQRADDPRLVEGGRGARRGIGHQQEPLVLGRQRRALDDDGHGGRTLLAPALQALEAIDDLEEAVVGGGDSQRQLGQLLRRAQALARAQLGEAGAQSVEG